jgi:hypothetical protein
MRYRIKNLTACELDYLFRQRDDAHMRLPRRYASLSFAVDEVPGLRISRSDGERDVCFWPLADHLKGAERVRSTPEVQTSTCSAIAIASSTSTPRYRTVPSILVWPNRSCWARAAFTASDIYMRQSEPPCSRKSAVPRGIFGSLASSNGAQLMEPAEV